MLKPAAQLRKLPENSTDIYISGAIERYAARPPTLEHLCLADFIALFTYKGSDKNSKDADNNDCDIRADVVEDYDDLSDSVDFSEIELQKEYVLNNGTVLRLRKRPKVIRFVRYNKQLQPKEFVRERVMLFHPWRNEILEVERANCEDICKNNSDAINRNSKKYIKMNEDINVIIQAIEKQRREEANESEEFVDEDLNVFAYDDNVIAADINIELNDGRDALNDPSTIEVPSKRYTMPDQLAKEEYLELCNSLNTKQRDYLMHVIHKFKSGNEPIYDFISGGAGVGKSRLIKAVYQSLLRVLRINSGPVEASPEIIIVSYTGKAAHNVGGVTAHSVFSLSIGQGLEDFKDLTSDTLNTLRARFKNTKVCIIDEISMLGWRTLNQISRRLCQVTP